MWTIGGPYSPDVLLSMSYPIVVSLGLHEDVVASVRPALGIIHVRILQSNERQV